MASGADWPEATSPQLPTSAPPLCSALVSGLPQLGVGGVGRGGFYIPDSFQTGEGISWFLEEGRVLYRGGTVSVARVFTLYSKHSRDGRKEQGPSPDLLRCYGGRD